VAFPGYSEGIEECWMEIDGGRMRYLRAGAGPAVILLHGLMGYSFSWRFTIPALAPFATVYAPDMLGAGFSDRVPSVDHSVCGTAHRVLQFASNLGITSFDLVGTSRGGAVAIVAAAAALGEQSGPRVRRLILVDPVNPYSSHGRWLAPFIGSPLGAALFRQTVGRMTFLYPYWHARMYGDRSRIPPGTLEGYTAPLAKPGLFDHALRIVKTWTEDLHALEMTLSKLTNMPALLMWGSKDKAVYPSSAKRLMKFFPNSKLVVFPGIGHLPYEECPDEFNKALIEFLMSS
jgi:pimeloyl-ACP methyl ester carboxylesterase